MKKIVVLGSTGSIGENALKIIGAFPGMFEVAGLSANTNAVRLVEQAKQFHVKTIVLSDTLAAQEARALASGTGISVEEGERALCGIAGQGGGGLVLCAMVGLAGLRPVLAALAAGKDVALATKEVLVSAGELVMGRRAEAGVNLLPVDSEHSAIFQCLQDMQRLPWCVRGGGRRGETPPPAAREDVRPPIESAIRRLTLTASGGPFAVRSDVDFERVTPEQALAHPRWRMGRKVTVDSATMMNKGLEIMEARWLFNVPADRIGVVVHPESIVHSLVTFVDGSQMAQLSVPDMRFPIQYALTWPDRLAAPMPALDLARQGALTFAEPDEARFPCLRLAREAAAAGGTFPAVLNAADEVAVEAFLAGAIPFAGIWRTVERVMAAHDASPCGSLDAVFEADVWARGETAALCGLNGAGPATDLVPKKTRWI